MSLDTNKEDVLRIGDHNFNSRLFLGTGKFSSKDAMLEAIKASKSELVTVALRRFNKDDVEDDLYGPLTQIDNLVIMPNTSGAMNAEEAYKVAMLGRELSGSNFVKLEIHPNPHHLMPDPIETFLAAKKLVKEGFFVLPYMPADPVLAKRLEEEGCSAVMPLGAAIGSGKGLSTKELLKIIIRDANIPVVVDAGLRSPAEAAAAMELGCDAVLANSAIAAAGDPVAIAKAFDMGVRAGRMAKLAGLMNVHEKAVATSPLTSFLSDD